MRSKRIGQLAMALSLAIATTAQQASADEQVICTLAQDIGSREPLIEQGDCDHRISSASTFKIAISLMGFDSNILTDPETPEWPFVEGYYDWRPEWKKATTPTRWLTHSVIWYSQQITERLGPDRFAAYVQAFNYGNADVTGEEDYDGLTHAWLSSSLQISPREQIAFLSRMLAGQLPVSDSAVTMTKDTLGFQTLPGGWRMYGKTGAGFPQTKDGKRLMDQRFGWYVGWVEQNTRRIAFARLVRFNAPPAQTPGWIAKKGLTEALFAAGGPLD